MESNAQPPSEVQNIAFYRFVPVDQPNELARAVRETAGRTDLRGSVLVAAEGINGMLSGPVKNCAAFERWLRSDERFADIQVKRSSSSEVPFRRLRVQVKPEIVTMKTDGIDVHARTGPQLPPAEFRRWLREGRPMVVIDTRNDYEFHVGHFRGAVDPRTKSFGEFPAWVRENEELLRDKPVVMYCTGGIRCEKATSWMLDEGFDNVWQLEGGILNYFAEVPDADRDWQGDLFIFDDRVALDTRMSPADCTLCPNCGAPRTREGAPFCSCEATA